MLWTLYELLRFWQVEMEIHLSSCHLRQASKVPLLMITVTYLLKRPTSSFHLCLLSMYRAQSQISPGKAPEVANQQAPRPQVASSCHVTSGLCVRVSVVTMVNCILASKTSVYR